MINETRGLLCSIIAALVVITPSVVRAQTADHMAARPEAHWEGVSQFNPMDHRAFAMMEFEGKLIVGGEFNTAGGVVLNHIGSWNGSEWQPLGEGFNHAVKCLSVYQGRLIAGGDFTASGVQAMSHVAVWNGTEWEPMGEGFDASPTSFAEWDGKLVAGGWFSHAGDRSELPYTASWDGTGWSAMGRVTDGSALSAPPRDLIVHEGSLLAAGSFTCWCPGEPLPQLIARWNGSAWLPAGPHLYPDQVGGKPVASCFAIWDSMLVVGGTFRRLDSIDAPGVIGFRDGEWQPLGSGVKPGVLDLAIHQNRLFASGCLFPRTSSVAEWNGTSWESVPASPYFMRSLASYQSLLYGIGEFSYTDQIRAWNGTDWLPLPTSQGHSLAKFPYPVHWLVRYGDRVLSVPNWVPPIDLEDQLNSFSYGLGLHSFHGAQPTWDLSETYPFAEFRGAMVTRAWPIQAIHSWDGLSDATIPNPPSGIPTALATLDDRLIASSHVANCAYESKQMWAWDGTSWSPFADGLCMSQMGEWEWERWGIVRVLAPYREQLIAGGLFSYNDDAHHNLGAWTGANWTPLGDCPNDLVTCLLEYHGDLIAAGFFDHVGQIAASSIARWDGNEWHPLGLGTDGPIYAMVIHNDRLIVGGYFQNAGGMAAGNIAAWDGAGWLQLGSGVDGEVLTMVSNLGTLWVGGEFSRAGGQTSFHLAKWMEGPRAATFSNFTAQRGPNGVLIEASASYVPFGHQGFLVCRQSPDEARVLLTPVPIEEAEISFTDASPPLGPATYSIAGVASTGSVTEYASTQVAADPSLRFALLPSQPNPFQAGTSISFQNAQSGRIQVSVFDLQGRCVARIVDRSFPPGAHSVTWNGRDTSGRAVSAGTYFCRLTAPEGTRVQSLVRSGY